MKHVKKTFKSNIYTSDAYGFCRQTNYQGKKYLAYARKKKETIAISTSREVT